MVTAPVQAPHPDQPDLIRRDGLIIGGASMRGEYLEVYWRCKIWRRQRGVYDVTCLKGETEGYYYGRLLHMKRRLQDHGKRHDRYPDEPCRLAEDLRGSQNGEE